MISKVTDHGDRVVPKRGEIARASFFLATLFSLTSKVQSTSPASSSATCPREGTKSRSNSLVFGGVVEPAAAVTLSERTEN